MSSVFLSNVDDYLSPSQACINPLFVADSKKDDQGSPEGRADEGNKEQDVTIQADEASVALPRSSRRRRRAKRVAIGTVGDSSTRTNATTQKATVTMADCLACSGCVTTAETVLVEQHSLETLKMKTRAHTNKESEVVITVSPASLADLKRHMNGRLDNRKFATFLCRSLKATAVMDGNLPLSWSLEEAANEFVDAYRSGGRSPPKQSPPPPTIAHSALEYQVVGESFVRRNNCSPTSSSVLPVLSSSCPALVCLVEKSFARAVPHLSRVKSPMAIAGAYWKHRYCYQHSSNTDSSQHTQERTRLIFHVAIMPCHDKKLEASRKDLAWPSDKKDGLLEPDIDLVVTTNEILDLLEETAKETKSDMVDFLDSLMPAPVVDAAGRGIMSMATMIEHENATGSGCWIGFSSDEHRNWESSLDGADQSSFFPLGSGGYAEYVFRRACRDLFAYFIPPDQRVPWEPIETTTPQTKFQTSGNTPSAVRVRRRKSTSFYQVRLFLRSDGTYTLADDDESKPVLQFAAAYGMQALHRMLQGFKGDSVTVRSRLSSSTTSYASIAFDYVEAMACPTGGCLNGGGQVIRRQRADAAIGSARESPSDTRQRVQSTWSTFSVPRAEPALVSMTKDDSKDSHDGFSLRTRFHAVPAMEHRMGAAAGVKVQDTQW